MLSNIHKIALPAIFLKHNFDQKGSAYNYRFLTFSPSRGWKQNPINPKGIEKIFETVLFYVFRVALPASLLPCCKRGLVWLTLRVLVVSLWLTLSDATETI